jgi:hypothetical protein
MDPSHVNEKYLMPSGQNKSPARRQNETMKNGMLNRTEQEWLPKVLQQERKITLSDRGRSKLRRGLWNATLWQRHTGADRKVEFRFNCSMAMDCYDLGTFSHRVFSQVRPDNVRPLAVDGERCYKIFASVE